ncbi:penicillin-binding protein 1A [Virgibacillus alimentarius]|uniref:Penicillin-binding protein 1A n=1 Tax=Virgibacillus alimentarius TaxID=698769 RepID=A0ABS4S4C6_9BACI|nr:penicillin-binding protein 1A [Virgibacillus alimentarius]MBP2256349.1 penicillin-binding protein 1A [Virgibacillus alimentarius]
MADKRQTRTARRKQNKPKKKPIWKKILYTLLSIVLAIGIGVGALFTYYIATAPPIDEAKLSDPFPSVVLDQDGEVVESLGKEQRTKIEYEDLPQVLIDAVVATEDSRFFKHSGIDIRRIAGAIKANITEGFGSEGASTITQQVVENSFLTPDKKIKLKVQEQWLALQLERKYSKEEILEMYLNKIFYGSGAYGVAKASEVYFGKTDLNELTIPEAAILAGLPQRPSAYNPYENPELTKERMNTVLNLMVRHGKISEKEAEEARQVDIESLLAGKRPDPNLYEAFIQQVEKEVEEKVDGANINTDGLKIHTTLDQDAQKHVESLLTDSDENPIPYPEEVVDDEGNKHDMQAGMVVLDTQTGAIQAIGGRRNSEKIGGYNYAIDGGRQPGSTFKPIIAFGPAIEYNKWSTYHQINDDQPYQIAGSNKTIDNWNKQHEGWMSARYALSKSLNVPTLKTFDEVGYDKAQQFAKGLGLNFKDDKLALTDAIGGSGSLFTPLEVAGAYRAFGNEGIYNEPYAVTKVEFPDGKTVDLKPESEAVMSDYTAYMVTDMLKTVMSEGTGVEANIPGLHVAGKTGTTNRKNVDGSPDSWFSGYTTDYTISIWTGYDDNNIPLPNTKIPHALFKNTMTELSKDKETKDFVKPDSVVEVDVEKGSNPAKLPSSHTPSDKIITELFVKGHEPDKTSEKFDKLDPVSNLSATYDEDSNSIKVSWDYNSKDDIEFEVSASVNGGGMKGISSTEDKSIEISEVEKDAEYEIQVVAVNTETSSKSEPKTTKVKLSDEEDEDIPSVSDLSAKYNEDKKVIDVTWAYDGPSASFEVEVSPGGQTQTVSSNGIEVGGATPGETYTITVTSIGKDNDNKGDSQSTKISIPDDETSEGEEPEDPNEEEENDSESETDENNDQKESIDEEENQNTDNENSQDGQEQENQQEDQDKEQEDPQSDQGQDQDQEQNQDQDKEQESNNQEQQQNDEEQTDQSDQQGDTNSSPSDNNADRE